MLSFLSGVRPPSFRESKFWFVLGPEAEMLPAKAIWSLTTNIKGANFNTIHAVAGLSALGFSVIDIRDSQPVNNFDEQVRRSLSTSSEARRLRLALAPIQPKKRLVLVEQFVRNPDVVAEVLLRAGHWCEKCKGKAPFLRRKDGSPYLEVHHIKQLSDEGGDTVENAIALCPNCHRFEHHG